MKTILALIALLLTLKIYGRESGSIIQVQRKIRMSYLEPIPPKEYFVDLGERDGLKEGDTLSVYRNLPVVNGQAGGPWHLMRVNIGQVRVFFVGDTTALVRESENREPASLPPMDYLSFMIGDEVAKRSQLPR